MVLAAKALISFMARGARRSKVLQTRRKHKNETQKNVEFHGRGKLSLCVRVCVCALTAQVFLCVFCVCMCGTQRHGQGVFNTKNVSAKCVDVCGVVCVER